jgi:1,4-alpha-glucan branching enzyme
MIGRQTMQRESRVKVTFTLPADGRRVAVAGDFNQWDPAATPLRKRGKTCSASVTLDAGQRYAFRYVDDGGRWFDDDQAEGFESNGLGGTNCIIDLTNGA